MIKKMRRRLILAAMLAFFSVIMLIAVLVNVFNYVSVTRRADQTLSAILNFEGRTPMEPGPGDPASPGDPRPPFMGLPDLESNYMTRFFLVRFGADGNVSSVYTDYIASLDEDDAAALAEKVLKRHADRGYTGAYRYASESVDGATVVAFLNTGREQQSMLSLLILTALISGASLIIVFVLVVLLSGKAIRPIANNIRQQKQFITDASHELKTPLTSISTSLDVITMEHGEDEWTENIRKQTGRMSKLVSELVTLSRLDEDMPLPNKEQFSLGNAAWEIVDVYKPLAKAHEKNLSIDIDDDVTVYGDKAAVQQMLSVLLDNAVRYSDPKGDIRFSVYKKHSRACIEVFNTCRLDPPPDTERLFDRFYRPDSSRSSETGGTGVGLAIARAVVQAHGGTITASCPSGKTMTIKAIL